MNYMYKKYMAFKKGNTINLGRKVSEETRKKMSDSHKELKPSDWGAGFKKGNVPWNTHDSVARNAYYAGLIDGEGYIGILNSGIKFSDKKYSQVKVAVTMKGNECLVDGQKHWGGTMHERCINGKVYMEWRIYTKDAEKMLRDIWPFVKLKREQVEIALKYRELQTRKRSGNNQIGEDEAKHRKQLEDRMRELHLRKGKQDSAQIDGIY